MGYNKLVTLAALAAIFSSFSLEPILEAAGVILNTDLLITLINKDKTFRFFDKYCYFWTLDTAAIGHVSVLSSCCVNYIRYYEEPRKLYVFVVALEAIS